MERLGGEYIPIADKIGCSNSPHRKQFWSPIIMTDTRGCKATLRKGHQLLEIRSIFESHLNLRGDQGKKTNDSAQVCRELCREGV